MKAKELFQLAVRLLGLVFLYRGLMILPTTIPLLFADHAGPFFCNLLMLAWPLLVAWWLLRGAPQLVRLAYPEPESHDQPPPA